MLRLWSDVYIHHKSSPVELTCYQRVKVPPWNSFHFQTGVCGSQMAPNRLNRKIREIKKWKFSFFLKDMHCWGVLTYIFVVTYRVTNFLPKLMDMLLFSGEKTEFPFLVFPYFRIVTLRIRQMFFALSGDIFRRSATVSRDGLMESCTYRRCCGGHPPPPPPPPPGWHDNVMDGWGRSVFTLTKRTCSGVWLSEAFWNAHALCCKQEAGTSKVYKLKHLWLPQVHCGRVDVKSQRVCVWTGRVFCEA